jgi:Tfp pilus assembly protein PilV
MTKGRSVINQTGFSTVEALLAASVFSLIVLGLVGALLYGLQSGATAGNRDQAMSLAKEGMEAVRSIRDDDFDNLTDGTHGLALVSSEWTFSGSSDTTGIFTRSVVISTPATGVKEVTVTVTWQQTAQRGGTISLAEYFTNWTEPDETPPAAITDLAASNPTTTSVDLDWTAPGDDGNVGPAASYDIRYSTSTITEGNWASATQASGEPTPGAPGSSESFTVSGLASGTTFYFAIKTSDEVPNISALSNVPSATTTTAGTEADSLDVDVTNAALDSGDNSLVENMTVENTGGSTITVASMTVSWSGVPGSRRLNEITIDGSSVWTGTGTSGAVSDITDTALASGGGTKPWTLNFNGDMTGSSITVVFTMSDASTKSVTFSPSAPDVTAPAAVSDLAAGSPTTSSLNLTWTAPGDDGSSGTATSYDIRYSTSTITEGNWGSATQASGEPSPQVAGSSESFTVTGLSASTTYYFAIKTSDEVPNISAISNVPSGTTSSTPDTTAPSAVSDLAAGSPTTSSLNLTWTAPGDDGSSGTATSYDIRYSTSTITEGNWASATQASGEPSPQVAGSSESFTVTGLSASTTYYFAIKTSDEVPNISAISNVPSGTTTTPDTTAPAAVSNLATSSPTSSSITLTWTAPGDDGSSGTATSYDIRYATSSISEGTWGSATQASGEPSPQVAGSSESFTVTGLTAGTTYYFAIKTSDEVPNISAISNSPSGITTCANEADCLSINTSSASVGGTGNRDVLGITITNTGGSNIVLDKMTVSWSGIPGSRRLNNININGSTLWTGTATSGTVEDLSPNFTLVSAAGSYPISYLRWNASVSGITLSITFTMSDASTKTVSGITP